MLIDSNYNVTSTYYMSQNAVRDMRLILWSTSRFENLFTQFTDRSKLIERAYILPFKITGSVLRTEFTATDKIMFGDEFTKIGNDGVGTSGIMAYFPSGNAGDLNFIAHYRYVYNENDFLNNYIDYPTITEYMLHLPYIGFVDIDYVLLKQGFEIKYYFDITTGNAVCNIEINGIRYYEYPFNIGIPVSFSGTDTGVLRDNVVGFWTKFAEIGINVGMQAIGMEGVSLHTTIKSPSVTNKTTTLRTRNTSTNRLRLNEEMKTVKENSGQEIVSTSQHRNYGSKINSTISALVDLATMKGTANVNTVKDINTIFNSLTECYIKIRRPKYNSELVNNLQTYQGKPTQSVYKLNQCNGYVQVGMIHLNINAPFSELEEIDELLHSGIIINNPNAPEIIIDNTESTVEV